MRITYLVSVENGEPDGTEAQKPAALDAHVEVRNRQQATATWNHKQAISEETDAIVDLLVACEVTQAVAAVEDHVAKRLRIR